MVDTKFIWGGTWLADLSHVRTKTLLPKTCEDSFCTFVCFSCKPCYGRVRSSVAERQFLPERQRKPQEALRRFETARWDWLRASSLACWLVQAQLLQYSGAHAGPPTSSWSRWDALVSILATLLLDWLYCYGFCLGTWINMAYGPNTHYISLINQILRVGWRDCSVVKSTNDSQRGSSSVPSIHIAAHRTGYLMPLWLPGVLADT